MAEAKKPALTASTGANKQVPGQEAAAPGGPTAADTTETPAAAAAGLPVLYQRPVPLNVKRHGAKSLRPNQGFAFAREANAVPLNAASFADAMAHYPIVFAGKDPVMAQAVLGLRRGQNLFLGADGRWAEGAFVPPYIRRYPFILVSSADDKRFVLCIDEASDLLADDGEQPLFVDGKPGDVARQALQFCSGYQSDSVVTKAFGKALANRGVLVPYRAKATLRSSETISLGGFSIIDEKRLEALSDEVFLDWRRRGWLKFIYCHLLSQRNWSALVRRLEDAR